MRQIFSTYLIFVLALEGEDPTNIWIYLETRLEICHSVSGGYVHRGLNQCDLKRESCSKFTKRVSFVKYKSLVLREPISTLSHIQHICSRRL